MERDSLDQRRRADSYLEKHVTSDRFVWIAWGFVAAAIAALLTIGVRSVGWAVPIFLIVTGLLGMILGINTAKRLRAPRPLNVAIGLFARPWVWRCRWPFSCRWTPFTPSATIWGRGWYQNLLGPGSEYVVTAKRFHPDIENLGCVSYRIPPDEEAETCFRLQEDLAGFVDKGPATSADFLSCHGWSRGVLLGSVVRRRSTFDSISVGDPLPDCWRQGIASR